MHEFASGFFIGAATAAHQVEGNNINSDFWAQEQMVHTSYVEPSLDAVDHYNRYEEDIQLMATAGLNAYRFSIEWARIEPQEGAFDADAVQHYRDVIASCKANGLEPVITLHHFSSPKWLISKGGWEAETTPSDFARYVRYVMEKLGSELRYVCTLNEANMGIQVAAISRQIIAQLTKAQATGTTSDSQVQMGLNIEKMIANQAEMAEENKRVFGVADPQCFTSPRTSRGDELVMEAHRAARAVIREVCPHIKVGLTLSLHDIQALPGGEGSAQTEWNEEFTHYLPSIADDDFLGVQNYTRNRHDHNGSMTTPDGAELTQMDYEYYPQGLENVLRRVAQDFHGDLIVTENGIATSDDTRRVAFIETALAGVRKCIADGLPIKGYFCWSLLDNFEWQKGFSMQFGLIAVDRSTQKRLPKPSLSYLGSYCGTTDEKKLD
ncbi:glycoside hydrolase family 1 protein [Schaalia sp. ZJ405]|uniref:glycoside hydrolase family 1 protein n=1 Tax=Schaalia sp. ZJ405 TaxID=2709403 RepID=UPI0013E9BDF7|nr:family 1 glycosylhydrolase [Schaalia sp. ZJ405]QPK81646.1 glycoside hydrolase family 1 protein [Schaalia sp. ZJ405]